MGKATGFMDYARREPGYRPVAERLCDFTEVELTLTPAQVREQAARCMDCGVPFCHGAGCPLCNSIPDINDLVYRGRWQEALELLLATNNFPEFTSRVCPALCEPACVAGLVGQPVTIRQIERAVVEKGFSEGWVRPHVPATVSNKQVAVIGSGPAGLACADELSRMGHTVTVYERDLKPGGILRYGIPDFKLAKSVIDRRVALMQAAGVRFETNVDIGNELAASYLRKHFDAVCLAGGARQNRDLTVPGRELTGVHSAIDYLVQQNKRVAQEPLAGPDLWAAGRTVAVIGGGDTGSDCLGTALRQGAKQVYLLEILPQPPAERASTTPWPAWPYMLRTSSSHQEGGVRRWSVMTQRFEGKDGQVVRLHGVEVEWPGNKPVPRAGTEFALDVDLVLLAMGFTGPEKSRLIADLGCALDERGNVRTNARGMTSVPGVFAAGDMRSGASLVVRGIRQGRETAESIDQFLQTSNTSTLLSAGSERRSAN
jgi:glutamate synthase (NADPH/NADH) small chain